MYRSHPPVRFQLPLASVSHASPLPPTEPCPHCGSLGFNVHHKGSKSIKDPLIHQVPVTRYRCKRCGWVGRRYPAGIDSGRQSLRLKQLSVILYRVGLSLQNIRSALNDLDCPLSMTSIRHNVMMDMISVNTPLPHEPDRLRMSPLGEGRFSGPDGALEIRLVSASPLEQWLEIEVAPGPATSNISRRLEDCTKYLATSSSLSHSHQKV